MFAFRAKKVPYATIKHEKDSPKLNVFCAISKDNVHGQSFFEGNVTVDAYLQMLQSWLMNELVANEHEDFIYQKNRAPCRYAGLSQWQSAKEMNRACWW